MERDIYIFRSEKPPPPHRSPKWGAFPRPTHCCLSLLVYLVRPSSLFFFLGLYVPPSLRRLSRYLCFSLHSPFHRRGERGRKGGRRTRGEGRNAPHYLSFLTARASAPLPPLYIQLFLPLSIPLSLSAYKLPSIFLPFANYLFLWGIGDVRFPI